MAGSVIRMKDPLVKIKVSEFCARLLRYAEERCPVSEDCDLAEANDWSENQPCVVLHDLPGEHPDADGDEYSKPDVFDAVIDWLAKDVGLGFADVWRYVERAGRGRQWGELRKVNGEVWPDITETATRMGEWGEHGGMTRLLPLIWSEYPDAAQAMGLPLPGESDGSGGPKTFMSAEKANERARDILGRHGWPGSHRAMARCIGCSHETVRRLPCVQEYLSTTPGGSCEPKIDGAVDVESLTTSAEIEELADDEQMEKCRQFLATKGSDALKQFDALDPDEQRRAAVQILDNKAADAEDARPRYTKRRTKV